MLDRRKVAGAATNNMVEFMLAQLTAAVINFSMAAPEKPLRAEDFMASVPVDADGAEQAERSEEEIVAEARAVMIALMSRNK